MWILALIACDLLGGSPEVVSSTPVPPLKVTGPSAPEPALEPEAAAAATVACTEAERRRFQCELSNGKQIALCEAPGGLSFRFGAPSVELAFPATGYGPGIAVSRKSTGEDGEVVTVAFTREDYTYTLTSERTEDQFDAVFEVVRGKQRLSTAECTKLEGVDFTELKER